MHHARRKKRIRTKASSRFSVLKKIKQFLLHSLSTFIKGILAGIMISLGCVVYLSSSSKYVGSALFSIGLFAILSYGLGLYTANVGYITVQGYRKNIQLIPMSLGNIGGALASGGVLIFTNLSEKLSERAATLCYNFLDASHWSLFILSFFGGILIFIATDSFKNSDNNAQKYLGVFLAVMVLQLSGFEHSVSNIFYLTIAQEWTVTASGYIVIIAIGNSLGAVLIPLTHKLVGLIRKGLHKA